MKSKKSNINIKKDQVAIRQPGNIQKIISKGKSKIT